MFRLFRRPRRNLNRKILDTSLMLIQSVLVDNGNKRCHFIVLEESAFALRRLFKSLRCKGALDKWLQNQRNSNKFLTSFIKNHSSYEGFAPGLHVIGEAFQIEMKITIFISVPNMIQAPLSIRSNKCSCVAD